MSAWEAIFRNLEGRWWSPVDSMAHWQSGDTVREGLRLMVSAEACGVVFRCSCQNLEESRREAMLAVLAPSERERAGRFRRPIDRDASIGARWLLRNILGTLLDRPPEALLLAIDPKGKPYLADPADALSFNLSHSGGEVVVAVSSRTVGVDLECFEARYSRDELAIARRFFHRAEVALLENLASSERAVGFLALWTAKEAIVKALGTGLQQPLDAFETPSAVFLERKCGEVTLDGRCLQLWPFPPEDSWMGTLVVDSK